MNSVLIIIASLIVVASMLLFGYLVTVVAMAFGVIFTTCLMTKSLLSDFIYSNSVSVIKEKSLQEQKDRKSS